MQASYHPKTVVPDEVIEVLSVLQKSGYKLAVISNREQPYQAEIESLGLAPYLSFSVSGCEWESSMPEAEIFLRLCRRATVIASQAACCGHNSSLRVIGAFHAPLHRVSYGLLVLS